MFYNEQIERAVLGEMMNRNTFFEELTEEDFDNARHKDLFLEIKRRYEEKLPFTIIDLKDVGFKIFGNQEHVTMTIDSQNYFIPRVTIVELKKITEKRLMKRVIERSAAALETDGVEGAAQTIESGLLAMTMAGDLRNAVKVSDLMGTAISDIEDMYNRRGALSGIPAFFPTINKLTDGFQNSDYVIIAARPSMGKTAIANQFMLVACRAGYKVGFFSAEMPAKKILQRMVCSVAGVSLQDIRGGSMSAGQFHSLNEASEEINKFDLYIDDTPNIDISRLRIEAKRMRRKLGIQMLVVDYLGLLSSREHERSSIYERVTAISRQLKQLARELEIPVIVLAQINRDAEGKEPSLSNLRDSGAIEQDADLIMILHKRGESNQSAMDLIVAKHRNGPTGRAGVAFDQELQRFAEFKEPG